MNNEKALEIVNKIFKNVFSVENPFSLDDLLNKFAFDMKLPQPVRDATTGELTYADSIHMKSYITSKNAETRDATRGWMLEKRELKTLDDLLALWDTINLTTTEREMDSLNILKSDTIYGCENIYRSTSCSNSKNLIFCDSCGSSEFLLASQRSGSSNFCIRCDDSKDCSNSYNVIYSNKVINSFFIQDCFNLYECMFCSHIASKRFCIANMEFSEPEYFAIKKSITDWILNS